MRSSPRTRRYFHHLKLRRISKILFSAHAEVFPNFPWAATRGLPLLRARGGISKVGHVGGVKVDSSPRTRRYFHRQDRSWLSDRLFSAHAEVFPHASFFQPAGYALLRARGGISNDEILAQHEKRSSPRTRRYFLGFYESFQDVELFSAHAEVFPNRAKRRTA